MANLPCLSSPPSSPPAAGSSRKGCMTTEGTASATTTTPYDQRRLRHRRLTLLRLPPGRNLTKLDTYFYCHHCCKKHCRTNITAKMKKLQIQKRQAWWTLSFLRTATNSPEDFTSSASPSSAATPLLASSQWNQVYRRKNRLCPIYLREGWLHQSLGNTHTMTHMSRRLLHRWICIPFLCKSIKYDPTPQRWDKNHLALTSNYHSPLPTTVAKTTFTILGPEICSRKKPCPWDRA